MVPIAQPQYDCPKIGLGAICFAKYVEKMNVITIVVNAEIKDCIAYLRVVHQEQDDLSFERIINVPKRSIGETTLKQISEFAKKNKITLEISAKKLIEKKN